MSIDLDWLRQQFPTLFELQPLSDGGQKIVLQGSHKEHGDVVLKLIRPTEDIEGIRREILAVQRIWSPRVPPILEFGQISSPVGDCFWIVEKRIHGVTLRERLHANGPLSQSTLLTLGTHILEALHDSEKHHIVHRDVKPENIIQGSDGQYWLLDFGIARHLKLDSQTNTLSPFGKFTPGYAPREQFRNIKSEIDSRADLFALGVTLYESATGFNPFIVDTKSLLEVLRRVESMKLPRLELPHPSPEGFADFVETLVQKRRDHRPSSAAEALSWLADISRGY
ncbi:MAG TPA: serine/threonine-protein kinase [Thermoanaerobaculia bacterium]|nr:serine/threonine-protein kinase [Thermoanaerobaculia bacterium]